MEDPTTLPAVDPAESREHGLLTIAKRPVIWIFVVVMVVAGVVGANVAPTWTHEKIPLDVKTDADSRLHYIYRDKPVYIDNVVPYGQAELRRENLAALNAAGQTPSVTEEFVTEVRVVDGKETTLYFKLQGRRHWRFWSLLPALVAVALCWVTREPLTALFGGIVAGALLLGRFDLIDDVLVKNLGTESSAGIIILYLWLLGGLMGIWARTGAAQAFAEMMTRHVVRGPKTAKLVAWSLGIIFFQGGTVSTVLVGTTVKPLVTKRRSVTKSSPTLSTRRRLPSPLSWRSTRGRATSKRSSSSPASVS